MKTIQIFQLQGVKTKGNFPILFFYLPFGIESVRNQYLLRSFYEFYLHHHVIATKFTYLDSRITMYSLHCLTIHVLRVPENLYQIHFHFVMMDQFVFFYVGSIFLTIEDNCRVSSYLYNVVLFRTSMSKHYSRF